MGEVGKITQLTEFERTLRKYLKEGREKLEKHLIGTQEAIRIIASDKTKDFIVAMDKGLNLEEREYLTSLIISSMYQSFCYGYGVGKVEGATKSRIYL